ncbi:MAG: MOFRL family protein, partial [Candidatus Saccharimonadales bacterium]
LSNADLVEAACEPAAALGYCPFIDNTCDDCDYRDACEYLLRRFRALRRESPRLCLISGGEVTVKLPHATGIGGRNQHFALAAAVEVARSPVERMAVLSVGSDGVDGNSDAAGAIADPSTVARARAIGIDPEAALARFDSGRVFATLGDAVVTGPTGNNLRDLRLVLGSL